MTHLSPEQLEAFVLGTLDPEGTQALAQHVRDCPACARRLQAEAAFEVLLRDVANTAASSASAPPLALASPWRRRRAVVGGLALALAAGVAALLIWRGAPSRPSPALELNGVTVSSRGVRCANGPTQADCLRSAQRRGLFVAYPPPVHTRYGPEEL
jgi:anti-sigma factor RsiW